jgi:polar amino acid transport system permease protein
MGYFAAMRYVILPQALRRILPPLAGQFINLIKDSSLLSAIALTELTKAGREVSTVSFANFEIYLTVAFMYLVLTFTLSILIQWMEVKMGVGVRE